MTKTFKEEEETNHLVPEAVAAAAAAAAAGIDFSCFATLGLLRCFVVEETCT